MRKHLPTLFALCILFAPSLQAQDETLEFHLISKTQTSYVSQGDQFKAELILVPRPGDDYAVSIAVDSSLLVYENGKASYRKSVYKLGQALYIAKAKIEHKQTGEVVILSDTFSYEVGYRCIATTADKMNVFYIGVDNPLSVSVAGVSSREVQVSISSGTLTSKGSGGWYTVQVEEPGEVVVSVQAPNLNSRFHYRAKRIPDPVPRIGIPYSQGFMSPERFKTQGGVILTLDNFDFDAFCEMQEYELVRLAADGTRSTAQNTGARFGEEARALIDQAVPGDVYWFRKISALCPGDHTPRSLQNFAIEIREELVRD